MATTTSTKIPAPEAFFTVRVNKTDVAPTLCGLDVGYERKVWRASELANHVVEWLPEFALAPSEWHSMQHANSVPLLRRAAKTVYESAKFQNRGEFGELFLHIAIRQVYNSLPAISKIFYKSATNDTVKGFDAVHIVGPPDDMELWLGEAKFYQDIGSAIRDVVSEIALHLQTDYLRSEFMLIKGKVDDTWPHSSALKKLLSPNTSLDEVFKRACIPILLTYDSDCLSGHDECTDSYIGQFENELEKHYATFRAALAAKSFPPEVRLHLFLLPLKTKAVLIGELDKKLKAWQTL